MRTYTETWKMIKIIWDEGFKKTYRKKIKRNQDLKDKFWKAVKQFTQEPFTPSLKTHKLTGQLEGLWAFKIDYDCRIVFKFIDSKKIMLIDIGSHDEVY